MSSRHTLSDILLYDAAAVCKVLPNSEGEVLLQGLPTMEGDWKQVASSHTHCIPISCSRCLVGDSRATQDRWALRLRV